MTLYVAAGACKSAIGKGLRYVRNPFSNLCEDYCRSIDTALEPIESQARHSVPAFCSCSTAQLWVLETVLVQLIMINSTPAKPQGIPL